MLENSNIIICDGTFFVAPQGFSQVYTIMGKFKNKNIPLIYCITKQKDEKNYEYIFNFIRNKINCSKKYFLIDNEKAPFNVIRKFFPDSLITGCYFHLSQILWQKFNKEVFQINTKKILILI